MDKIKNYNQIILAAAGTIGVILLLFLAGIFIWDTVSRWSYDDDDEIGILATEQTDILQEENLRKQIISFNRIQVLDSASQIFVIPVTQANLAKAEYDGQLLGLMNSKFSVNYERYSNNIYNNLVLYDGLNNRSEILFKDRISIEDFIIHESGNKKLIVISACNEDSNKDGLLNESDLQRLFIYDIDLKVLHTIDLAENYTTLIAYQPKKSNELVVHTGIDRNNNGKFDRKTEPMIFYKVNLQTMSLEEFVSKDQISTLQGLLEGSK